VAFDLVIRGGLVVDGTGRPGHVADVAVLGGRVVEVGTVRETAARTIDAAGLAVAPGFIDLHTHYDAQAFWDPTLSPSPLHGVTTIVGGNCGFSIAPLNEQSAEYIPKMLARVEGMPVESLLAGVPWDWSSTADYLGRLEGTLVPNSAWLVGHSALRAHVMGPSGASHPATAEQVEQMAALLRAGLRSGAIGFSSTWAQTHNDHNGDPVPSRYADADELVALSSVVGEFEGTTLGFIPTSGEFSDEAIEIMAAMSRAANRPLNWNSLNVQPSNDAFVARQLSASDHAAAHGGRVVALTSIGSRQARLNFHSGFVFDALPGWNSFFGLPPAERMRVLEDPNARAELDRLAQTASGSLRGVTNWASYVLAEIYSEQFQGYTGKTVGSLAEDRGIPPFDALCEVIVADELRTVLLSTNGVDDGDVWTRRVALWRDPRVLVGASDAGAHLDMTDGFTYTTSLLATAVRQRRLLSLEEAVHLITQRPSALYGLRDRGTIAIDARADLVVFDPETVGPGESMMRYDMPEGGARVFATPVGIEHVFVNGTEAVRGSTFTGAHPGHVLRSGRDTKTVFARPTHSVVAS
jgi:N-acyl-D-aspartate/D-glutamate deacylase